ncbi:hypothetical protein TNCV_976721 [Trichonephila clavipes]|nr:hypothetical protein TNCV_976721 [Trichonephila clavipes]
MTQLWSIYGAKMVDLFFFDVPGGTGKTFLLNLVLVEIRMKGDTPTQSDVENWIPTMLLLRNLSTPKLYNGTRLSTKKMMLNVIEATITNGKCKGEDVLIPRIKVFRNFGRQFQHICVCSPFS